MKDLKTIILPGDFCDVTFPPLSCLKLMLHGSDSPPCVSDSLLTASRRELACLQLFIQWMEYVVGFHTFFIH
jgi:hypothetical protein